MPKYTLLLADADGTLLDFAAAEDKALKAAMAAVGVSITEQDASQYAAINQALWRAFERKEVTQPELRVLRFARFFEFLGVHKDAEETAERFTSALSLQADALEGAEAFLREAAARVPVVIVTNGIASVQRSRFGISPMRHHIRGYVISGEVGFAKPDPRMIDRALAIAEVPGARPLMLGDEPLSDIAAALNAGIDSCWFNPSGRENPTPYQPTHEIRELSEVLSWL